MMIGTNELRSCLAYAIMTRFSACSSYDSLHHRGLTRYTLLLTQIQLSNTAISDYLRCTAIDPAL